MRKSNCRGCGKPILWIRTIHGKSIPVDPEPVMFWQHLGSRGRVVTNNGEVVACKLNGDPQTATGIGYVPHWATCPKYKDFKKG